MKSWDKMPLDKFHWLIFSDFTKTANVLWFAKQSKGSSVCIQNHFHLLDILKWFDKEKHHLFF